MGVDLNVPGEGHRRRLVRAWGPHGSVRNEGTEELTSTRDRTAVSHGDFRRSDSLPDRSRLTLAHLIERNHLLGNVRDICGPRGHRPRALTSILALTSVLAARGHHDQQPEHDTSVPAFHRQLLKLKTT